MFDRFWSLVSYDIGIDLGTANTLIHVKNKGIVIREPSVVAQHKKTKSILAIGREAKKMVGKTPANIVAIKPLTDGVISDFEITEQMLRFFIKKVHETPSFVPKLPRPRVVVGIPSGVTEVERKAVADAATRAGAREVHLIEEPMAAAIGAGLPIEEAKGNMIVDIGGGTAEIAVISLGGIVVSRSLRIAGSEMDQEVVNFAKEKFNLLLGERTAEEIKIKIGSAFEGKEEEALMRGRDLRSGLPKAVTVSSGDIREALKGPVEIIINTIKDAIEDTPPEILADIMEEGIVLAGGGSLLKGLDKLIALKTEMLVKVAEDPLTCVVRGTGKTLEDISLLRKVRIEGRIK